MKQWLLGGLWAIFIIAASVVITLNFRPLYYWEMEQMELAERTAYTEQQIRENYDILIDYQNFWGPDRLEMPDFPMSDTGRIHFEEVKVIFVTIEYLALISLLLAVAGTVWLRRQGNGYLLRAAVLTPALPVVVGAAVAINWDWAFVTFHEIFFDNDYWIFNAYTDPVIRILPDIFFLHCAVMILLLILLGGGICLTLYLLGRKKRS
ncbi:MAG: TIGR01906 family membrane protein [Ruminococcaceae bacterium]|nr:TIGR01906 family membrane protein [Oscillospiraceae bacterium]